MLARLAKGEASEVPWIAPGHHAPHSPASVGGIGRKRRIGLVGRNAGMAGCSPCGLSGLVRSLGLFQRCRDRGAVIVSQAVESAVQAIHVWHWGSPQSFSPAIS